MINQQIIDRLAEYMGWEKVIHNKGWRNTQTVLFLEKPLGKRSKTRSFDPINNWNHWREVEEKLCEDKELRGKYIVEMSKQAENNMVLFLFMKADLPTRCKAIISVLPTTK